MRQAYALVITPEYRYWNPMKFTAAKHDNECRILAHAYALKHEPFKSDPWRRARLLREMRIMDVPAHQIPLEA